jgi:predicted nucleic acid-binding protein
MADELVLDASVAAKCFFTEDGSDEARALVLSGARLIAPELIFAEIASVAAKGVRRGLIPNALARDAVAGLRNLLDETKPIADVAPRAFAMAAAHGLSAYDGCYLALAEARGTQMVTADAKLVTRATEAGLAALVRTLS